MPIFEYTALDRMGKVTTGLVDADDARSARSKLRARGIYPTAVKQEIVATSSPSVSFPGKERRDEVTFLTRQLTTLLEAGLPLVQALSSILDQPMDRRFKTILTDVRDRVKGGSHFSEALSAYPEFFSSLYASMVRAGEASGSLETVLRRLAEYGEKQKEVRNRIRSALVYPVLMVLIGTGVFFFILSFILPIVTRVFIDMGENLPLPTTLLISLSSFMASFWWAIILVAGFIVFAIRWYIHTEKGRYISERILLKLPLLGSIVQKTAVSRFCRTLSTLIGGGMEILPSLDIVKEVVGSSVFSRAISEAREEISEGESITSPLGRSGLFPPLSIRMIAAGEESGNLDGMLLKVADTYDGEVESTVNGLTSLLEPLIIVVMGVAVGFVVLAVLLPIFEMNRIIR